MTTRGEDIIVKKALDLVWQNPRKDKQSIVQLSRISPMNGYMYTGKVHWDTIETPTETGYYHFYQIGDNYPGDFTLIAKKNQWYRLSDWCKVIDLVIHLYDKKGRLISLDNAYTIRLYNDNIIIAVLRNDHVFDLNTETLYIHFYRNYFYTTEVKDKQEPHIEYYSNTQGRKTPTRTFMSDLNLMIRTRKSGKFRLTHNGYLVESVDTNNLTNGEVTELHYDMSVRKIVDLKVSTLRTFKSTLDKITKYLIHPPKDSVNVIDYRDDIDIFIYKKDKVTKKIKGVYYHRNMEDAVRMVTHRDYSLPVPYVMSYIEHLDPNPDLNDFYIRLYVRDNGPRKPLIEDVNMIKSLYLLKDSQIVNAMTQVNSTVPEWKAAYLEESAYPAIMRSYREEITPALVLDGFGYTATVKALAYPNIRITPNPNGNYFKLPEGVYERVTIFEYDQYGLLLGWYYQTELAKYYPRNKDCIFIEAIAGEGGDNLTMHLGKEPFDLQYDTAYRFYLTKVEAGKKIGEWQDATGDSRILVDGTRCTFNHKDTGELGLCLGDDKFLCYEQYLDGTDGIFDFQITHGINHTDAIDIPPGRIDLWLNGRALVEGIDYFVDFPRVVIVTKEYTHENTKQLVTVRCTGFPFMEGGYLKRVLPREVGFIQYGEISVNARFDVHEDKVLRTVVDGGVFDPAVIPFDERGSANVERFVEDGRPYSVEHPYVNLLGTMGISVYSARNFDYELSKRVSDYLTRYLPKAERQLPPVIDNKYQVYSPFMSKIIMDLKYGRLKSPLPKVDIQTIDKLIEKYKTYLTMDPVIRGYDSYFVKVHAHNNPALIELSARDVAFLERLNDIYLKGEVDVSKFLKIRKGK